MSNARIWQKDVAPDAAIDRFTAGNDRVLDNALAEHDVLGSMAHARMLHACGMLTDAEAQAIQHGLHTILAEVRAGTFTVGEQAEDIHSQVEMTLTERIGEAGKKLHTARSRNDQVLLDIKLYTRHRLQRTVEGMERLFQLLMERSAQHQHVPLPGYTHWQIAMPSTFGLWFAAHAETLSEDLELLLAAYRIADRNPLGSAAGFGSSFPIDRALTTRLLGFADMNTNVVHAQMTRGRTERTTLVALASVASTLGRLASDAVLYLCGNYDFLRLPEELTTGSSIMPHKKNPDAFELVRAHCNVLQGLPQGLALLLANLPTGYHRDLQLTKEFLLPAFDKLDDCLSILHLLLSRIEVREDILSDPRYAYLFSVDAVHARVRAGEPFRDAYRAVGLAIAAGHMPEPGTARHTLQGGMHNPCNAHIVDGFKERKALFAFDRAQRALRELEEVASEA